MYFTNWTSVTDGVCGSPYLSISKVLDNRGEIWYNGKVKIRDNRRYCAMTRRRENGWPKKLFNATMEAQNKRCAICGCQLCDSRDSGEKLLGGLRKVAADHDHITGQPRGILCTQCNSMLGFAHDNPDVLEKAATYLRFHQKKV